jgi:K+-sensing histidine kinase KdpD
MWVTTGPVGYLSIHVRRSRTGIFPLLVPPSRKLATMSEPLQTAIRQLIAAQTENEIQQTAVTTLHQLLDADYGTLAIAENESLSTKAPTTDGTDPPFAQLLSGDEIIDHAYTSGKSCIIDDLTDVRSASSASPPDSSPPFRSLLCVPVGDWGLLVAAAYEPAAFTDGDLEAIDQLGTYIKPALDRVHSPSSNQDDRDRLKEIASVLSHDVRNQLSVAAGYLELAREDHERDHLNQVAVAHERIEELLDDMIALARTGDRVSELVPVEFREAVEWAWMTVDTDNAELVVGDSAAILADESSLCQLLENLFRNAIDHSGPTVIVRVGCFEDGGFYVEDDGPGIPRDKREHVFSYGYSSTDDQTGFGLSIVQRIVDAHEWEIAVTDSEIGGARFEITDVAFDSSIRTSQ